MLLGSCRLQVYTTRPDTLFGATYLVLAPEHPMLMQLVPEEKRSQVAAYVEAAARKSDIERTELQKDKSGVFTGSHALNPATGEEVPIWVADYVLGSYGSGAIMAVPAHDSRDFEFAQKFGISVKQVVGDAAGAEVALPFAEQGVAINSSSGALSIDGLSTAAAQQKVLEWLEANAHGNKQVRPPVP